jgi:hypothetical protein
MWRSPGQTGDGLMRHEPSAVTTSVTWLTSHRDCNCQHSAETPPRLLTAPQGMFVPEAAESA